MTAPKQSSPCRHRQRNTERYPRCSLHMRTRDALPQPRSLPRCWGSRIWWRNPACVQLHIRRGYDGDSLKIPRRGWPPVPCTKPVLGLLLEGVKLNQGYVFAPGPQPPRLCRVHAVDHPSLATGAGFGLASRHSNPPWVQRPGGGTHFSCHLAYACRPILSMSTTTAVLAITLSECTKHGRTSSCGNQGLCDH
jgi:hypothetical protein